MVLLFGSLCKTSDIKGFVRTLNLLFGHFLGVVWPTFGQLINNNIASHVLDMTNRDGKLFSVLGIAYLSLSMKNE
jgi:hypothetical protein